MAKEKTREEIVDEWWKSLGSYKQVIYLKMYVPNLFQINDSVKEIVYTKVFETEIELKLENPK